jgi:glycosyltransferase involved in cell wall biosynthesis
VSTQRLYAQHYAGLEPRCHVIYNGADLEDFASPLPRSSEVIVAHVGTVHEFQWPQIEFFLRAFAEVRKTAKVPSNTALVFAGAISPRMRRRIDHTVGELGLEKHARVRGFVSHPEAIVLMRQSRLLLVFAAANPYFRPSKLSEYLAAGSPILAFAAPASETAKEVRAHGGLVFDFESEPAARLESELANLLAAVPGETPEPVSLPRGLDRRTESEMLARILSSLTERPS